MGCSADRNEDTMTAGERSGRRADAVANRARILDAARAVMVERGLDMEMDQVAAQAGVGVGTLYRHFAKREDLVRAVVWQAIDNVVERSRAAAALDDPAAALRVLPLALATEPGLVAVIQDPRAPKSLASVREESQPLAVQVLDLIAGILVRGMRSGAFRADLDPMATAAAILGSTTAVNEFLGPTRSPEELADLLADLHQRMVAAE